MRPSRRFLALILAALCLIPAAPIPAYAERTLALSSMSYKFDVIAGKGGRGEVTVSNEGSQPMTVLVYAADQVVDDKGAVTFTTPNRESMTTFSGPASWLRLEMPSSTKAIGNTPYLELKPGQAVPVKFSFEVPATTASGDHNSIIFFEMVSLDSAGGGSISRVAGRIGARVRIRVKGDILESLALRPFTLDKFVLDDTLHYNFTVRNNGNVDKRVRAALVLSDGRGTEHAGSKVMTETAVYAGKSYQSSGKMEAPAGLFGKYTARLTVEYLKEDGGTDQIVQDRTVWFLPGWTLGAAIGFAVLVVLWIVWRIALSAAHRRVRRGGRGSRRAEEGFQRQDDEDGASASAERKAE